MSNNLRVLLVGCGNMGVEYVKVLKEQGADIIAVGRSKEGTDVFFEKTGIQAIDGGIEKALKNMESIPKYAIVCTPIMSLKDNTSSLIVAGVKNILLEKPAGMDISDIEELCKFAEKESVNVYVAYNRRFYSSVIEAEKIIAEDGGVRSFLFEFTEWADTIEKTNHPDEVKQRWLLANSTHVIDLAFYLGGKPVEMNSIKTGALSWHKNGAVYAGSGITDKGALFSYNANWDAPGRWSVEILTSAHRLYFKPMEKLAIQNRNSVAVEEAQIDYDLDLRFKPGLYRQVEAFLNNDAADGLKTIEEQLEDMKVYMKIAGVQ